MMNDILENKELFSTKDFFELMPDVPKQTVYSRIRALERAGRIFPVGRGLFRTGCKLKFNEPISEKMEEVNKYLIEHCEGVNFCLSSFKNNLILYVSKSYISLVIETLKLQFKQVADRKSASIVEDQLSDFILVDKLTSEAPISHSGEIRTPSIEKKLVDYVCDKSSLKSNLPDQFQSAFEVYEVNVSTLKRYAARRGVKTEVEKILDKLDNERIAILDKIQLYLCSKPVSKAWIFGSFARREERDDSDIDILISLNQNSGVGLMALSEMELEMENLVSRPVDLVLEGSLKPFAEPSVNHDKVLIYERA